MTAEIAHKDYENICHQCIPIVRDVGAFIAEELGNVRSEQIEVKEENSLVSYVDKEAEKTLVRALGQILPEATFITEENTVSQSVSDHVWIIDPLDGTTNFLQGIPHFAVSVGLEVRGEIVVGLVLEVNSGELFYAWQGGGAYLNGKSIQVAQKSYLKNTIIGTGFPYNIDEVTPLMIALEQLVIKGHGIRRMGAAALDLAYVACGRLDCYYETGLNAWDVAGGAIIVKEAGGVIIDFTGGKEYLYGNQVIAANASLAPLVQEILSAAFGLTSPEK